MTNQIPTTLLMDANTMEMRPLKMGETAHASGTYISVPNDPKSIAIAKAFAIIYQWNQQGMNRADWVHFLVDSLGEEWVEETFKEQKESLEDEDGEETEWMGVEINNEEWEDFLDTSLGTDK